MDKIQQLTAWLGDAYAMEQNLIGVLGRQIPAAAEDPLVQRRLEEHLEETKRHAALVEECLAALGAPVPLLKSMAGGLLGIFEGLSTAMFSDQLLKNLIADYAMEHLEIAAYSSLIAAAEECGMPGIAKRCSWILREEAAMAGWLEEQVPLATRLHLLQPPRTFASAASSTSR